MALTYGELQIKQQELSAEMAHHVGGLAALQKDLDFLSDDKALTRVYIKDQRQRIITEISCYLHQLTELRRRLDKLDEQDEVDEQEDSEETDETPKKTTPPNSRRVLSGRVSKPQRSAANLQSIARGLNSQSLAATSTPILSAAAKAKAEKLRDSWYQEFLPKCDESEDFWLQMLRMSKSNFEKMFEAFMARTSEKGGLRASDKFVKGVIKRFRFEHKGGKLQISSGAAPVWWENEAIQALVLRAEAFKASNRAQAGNANQRLNHPNPNPALATSPKYTIKRVEFERLRDTGEKVSKKWNGSGTGSYLALKDGLFIAYDKDGRINSGLPFCQINIHSITRVVREPNDFQLTMQLRARSGQVELDEFRVWFQDEESIVKFLERYFVKGFDRGEFYFPILVI